MKKQSLLIILLLLSSARLQAAFEDRGLGARPVGMGNAFTAVADDVHAVHYNPAGLSLLTRPELTSSYGKLLVGLDDGSNLGDAFLGYAQPIQNGDYGSVAIGYKDFRLANLYKEQSLYLGYGSKIPFYDALSAGMTLKYLSHGYGSTPETENAVRDDMPGTSSGAPDPLFDGGRGKGAMALDMGFLYEFLDHYRLGLSLANLNQPNTALSGTDKLSMSKKLGFAYTHPLLNLSVDLDQKKNLHSKTDTILALGAERWIRTASVGSFAVRGSLSGGSRDFRQATFGAAYLNNHFQFDYAFVMPLSGISGTMGTHQVGITLKFAGPDPEDEFTKILERESKARQAAEEKLARAQAEVKKAHEELARLKDALAQVKETKSSEADSLRAARAQAQSNLLKAQARQTSAIHSLQSAYNISLNFYKKRSAQGLSQASKVAILERILAKYNGKGLDLGWVERELDSLKGKLEKLRKDYNLSWDYYKRLVDQGAPLAERRTILQRIIKKYETTGLDMSETKRELERLKQ